MSDKKDKKDKGSKTEKVTTPAATFVAPAVGPVPMTLLQRTVETEIITKWNTRPFARFPIHKDVPRFIRTIKVVTDKGEELYKADAAEPQNVAVRRLISAFSTAFEPSNVRTSCIFLLPWSYIIVLTLIYGIIVGGEAHGAASKFAREGRHRVYVHSASCTHPITLIYRYFDIQDQVLTF